MEPPTIYGGKTISNMYVSICLRKVAIVSEDLILIWSLFQIVGATTENPRLFIFRLLLEIKSLYIETDDLRVLRISGKYNILTKFVG